MNSLSTRVVSDIDLCRELWTEFSPKKTFYDLWDFRIEFWKVFQYKPHFIVLSKKGKNVGLLPLWHISDKKGYFWFGDIGDTNDWMEENNFWVKDAVYLKPLLETLPTPISLVNLTIDCFRSAEGFVPFQKHNPKNVLSIGTYKSVEDYLMTLSRKLRGNLVRDRRIIGAQNPKIIIDNFSDFDTLIRMNIARHKESAFKNPKTVQAFHGLIRTALEKKAFQVRMVSVYIDDKPAGFDFIFIYNGVYCPLLCANDVSNFSGIGNFMNLYDIKDAIDLRMKEIDFAEGGENYYKNRLFPVIEQYKIEIPKL